MDTEILLSAYASAARLKPLKAPLIGEARKDAEFSSPGEVAQSLARVLFDSFWNLADCVVSMNNPVQANSASSVARSALEVALKFNFLAVKDVEGRANVACKDLLRVYAKMFHDCRKKNRAAIIANAYKKSYGEVNAWIANECPPIEEAVDSKKISSFPKFAKLADFLPSNGGKQLRDSVYGDAYWDLSESSHQGFIHILMRGLPGRSEYFRAMLHILSSVMLIMMATDVMVYGVLRPDTKEILRQADMIRRGIGKSQSF